MTMFCKKLVVLASFSLTAVGCAPHPEQQAVKPATSATSTTSGTSDRHVYRLDFVLTAHDEQTQAPSSTSFTLNLEEHEKGEIHVGENVSLSSVASGAPTPRSDTGAKVHASYRTIGDDLLLDINVEMSSFYPPSNVQKVVVRSSALASAGKSALVTTLQDQRRHYELTVTPSKLR